MMATIFTPPPHVLSSAAPSQHINYAQPMPQAVDLYNEVSMVHNVQQHPSLAAIPGDVWLWQSPMLTWPYSDVKTHPSHHPLCSIGDSSSVISSPDTGSTQDAISKDVDYFSHCPTQVKQGSGLAQDNKEVSASHSRLRRCSTAGPRPHECSYCPRTFARRHDLERHTRLHTGLKPYICPCCYKAFPRSDARGRHFRNEAACRNGPQVLALIKKNMHSTI